MNKDMLDMVYYQPENKVRHKVFKKCGLISLAIFALVLLTMVGCNTERSIAPLSSSDDGESPFPMTISSPGKFQLAAKVQTVDQNRRMLTFEGTSDTVIALANCQVTRLQNNQEAMVQFSEVRCGDTVHVYGDRIRQELVYANRLMLSPQAGQGLMVAARIASKDRDRLMLTFADCPDTVIANQNCEVVRWRYGWENKIDFNGLHLGDTVEVFGERLQNQYVYANRIKACGDGFGLGYDIAIRDTIVTIDYSAGTFTVAGRSELITADEATAIWGNIARLFPKPQLKYGKDNAPTGASGSGLVTRRMDTLLTFTDLQVGDVVEIRAEIIDEVTLHALSIKVANCDKVVKECVIFESHLTAIDATASTVTFSDQPWIGFVCNGAKLLDVNGNPITLLDFAVEMKVAVKGFPQTTETLKVCEMQILP